MTAVSLRRARLLPAAPSRALRYLPATTFVLDAVLIGVSTSMAMFLRLRLDLFEPATLDGPHEHVGWIALAIAIAWLLAIVVLGGYSASVFGAGPDEYKRVVHASLLTAGLVGVTCYLAKYQLSRGFFLLAFAIAIPSLMVGRLILRRAVHRAHVNGALRYRVVIAGSPAHIDEIAGVLRRETWLGYEVVGALTPDAVAGGETPSGIPIIGNTDEITWSVVSSRANLLFFAGGAVDSASELRRIAWALEKEDVQVVVAPSVTEVSGGRVKFRPVGGLPLIHVDPPRATEASRWGKRLFDVVGSLGLLVLFSPIFLVAALRVKLHDGGTVLFRQERVGKDGLLFSCLKFRSMVIDAEAKLAELHAQTGYESGLFKLKDDPRITTPGAWLRKFSLDELPQLVNVLRGDMSLVGPRPPLPVEVANYERDTNRRLDIRPGLTGLWQVSGRSDLSWDETVRLDLYYVDNWSMLQDLNILLKTLGAMMRPEGAY
ncbi:MAG: sugar transferase [Actinomycetota bacterium]|nr:sugar transferase [Actinomycetota bacterium]